MLWCHHPPVNASSWATKNIVSRHEVKTYLGKIFKNNRLPGPLHSFASKSHIWWFCRMSLDEGVLLQEQTCLQSLQSFQAGPGGHISTILLPTDVQGSKSLVVLSDRPKCTPTMHGIWQYPHLFKRFKPRFWWMKVGTKILPLIRLCCLF